MRSNRGREIGEENSMDREEKKLKKPKEGKDVEKDENRSGTQTRIR